MKEAEYLCSFTYGGGVLLDRIAKMNQIYKEQIGRRELLKGSFWEIFLLLSNILVLML
jgi:hypothetical protein